MVPWPPQRKHRGGMVVSSIKKKNNNLVGFKIEEKKGRKKKGKKMQEENEGGSKSLSHTSLISWSAKRERREGSESDRLVKERKGQWFPSSSYISEGEGERKEKRKGFKKSWTFSISTSWLC